MQENQYRLEEIAEVSGVSSRTVRYYTAEGLLPPPDARGRVALYSDVHLQRLKLIQRLKEAYFPLDAIKKQLSEITDAQVTELLNQEGTPALAAAMPSFARTPSPAPAGDAASYIARVLSKQSPARAPTKEVSIKEVSTKTPAETWQRITLAPGVELHVRAIDEFVSRIIEYAKTLHRTR